MIDPILKERPTVSLAMMQANSFKDFHAKGLDYMCLKRSDAHTVKLYLLDGDVSKLPEAVNPHDHRYAFRTQVLAGSLVDWRWSRSATEERQTFDVFNYDTPLNGGAGFTHQGETEMGVAEVVSNRRGATLWTSHDMIHTIKPLEDQTVLILDQLEDVVPVGEPTRTYVRSGDPAPDTSGLYDRFTVDELIARMQVVSQLTGVEFDFIHDI